MQEILAAADCTAPIEETVDPEPAEKRVKSTEVELRDIRRYVNNDTGSLWTVQLGKRHPLVELSTKCVQEAEEFLLRSEVKIFGRVHTPERMQGFFSDGVAHYAFSGLKHVSQPLTASMAPLLELVQQETDFHFNGILVNKYYSASGLGHHSDDERGLAANNAVASISIGALREMELKPKKLDPEPAGLMPMYRVQVRHGTLLVMEGNFQKHYTHAIRKTPAQQLPGVRYSLTFRLHK